jgi:hypothetical protein
LSALELGLAIAGAIAALAVVLIVYTVCAIAGRADELVERAGLFDGADPGARRA